MHSTIVSLIRQARRSSPSTFAGIAFGAFALCLAGCGGVRTAAPVQPDKAREALRVTLDQWKGGSSIDDFRKAHKEITVQDFDWMSGTKLSDYQVADGEKYDDANLRIPVTLTLLSKEGGEVVKKVTYVVGTSPSVTVFRDFK